MWNSRSIATKASFIQSYILSKGINIICLTETWLNYTYLDYEILSRNYCIYRRDRGSRGGGVLIGIHKSIPSRLHQNNIAASNEIEQVTIEVLTTPVVVLCCLYIPPNSPQSYLESILHHLNSLSTNENLTIVGDFNITDINWLSLTGSSQFSQDLCNLVFDKNLTQLITLPTHVHGNILDLILTNIPHLISDVTVDTTILSSISDHYTVLFNMVTNSQSPQSQQRTHFLFNYKKN